MKREWHAQRTGFLGTVDLYRATTIDGERTMLRLEPTEQRFERGMAVPVEPSLQLNDDEAQQLMNELWRAGFRPMNGESSLAQVDAMREHLSDMRKLVFESPLLRAAPQAMSST